MPFLQIYIHISNLFSKKCSYVSLDFISFSMSMLSLILFYAQSARNNAFRTARLLGTTAKYCSNIVTAEYYLRLFEKPTINIFSVTATHLHISLDTEQHLQQENQDNASRSDEQCSSTLPYVLSRWSECSETKLAEGPAIRKSRVKAKYDSDSLECMPSTSSPVEICRKLEEKRAIFQRRFFDSKSRDETRSDETVIDLNIHDDLSNINCNEFLQQREEERKKKVRHISVRTFDTFSTFGNTLDEEDFSEDYNDTDSNYRELYSAMAPMLGATDHLEVRCIA